MKSPYTLVFGREPIEAIPRIVQRDEILNAFKEDPISQQIYMITGIRGCGKTVFMTEIANELSTDKNWVIVNLNSSGDLLNDFAASLGSENSLAKIFKNASINLSLFGIGLEVKESVPISSIQVALTQMLESLKKHNKKVLICVDEVTVTESMKVFAGAFQIFIRQNLQVFLIMTGLYENINNLQNEKNLTFLYRAPKIELKPLNIRRIANNYKANFNLSDEDANHMAALTNGYPFAFQVLGYYTCKYDGDYKKAIPEYKHYLEDYVYEKVYSELSQKDRQFAGAVARTKNGKAKDVKDILGIADNEYSVYRDRLVKRGLLDGSEHGYVKFILPLFDEYLLQNNIYE